ncbi:uncharacterized protein [Dermacentor albipictus]|uniref:uncharacterized protein isoform X2 n=1 Tax=Dermacentor albipictus TaxID=60249 RepID=UPI0031FCFC74
MTTITLRSFSSGRKPSKRTYDVASRRDGKRFKIWPEVHKKRSVALEDLSASPSPHTTPLLDSPEAKDVDRGFRRRWQHLERGDFDDEDERVSEAHWAIVAAVVSSTSIVIAFFVFVALAFHARADVVAVRHRASRPQEFASPVLAQLIAYGENVTVPAAPAKSYRPQMSSKLMAMGDADVQCSAEAVTTRAAAVAAIITGSSAQAASSNVSRKDCNPPECG